MISFNEGNGVVPYMNIYGDGTLCYYRKFVDNNVYIFIEIPDKYYGFKEMVANLTQQKIIETYGFSKEEAMGLVAEFYEEESLIRWRMAHPNEWCYCKEGDLVDIVKNHFIECFIPSKDTAAYLASVGYKFTNYEKAIIVANHEMMTNSEIKEVLQIIADLEEDIEKKSRIIAAYEEIDVNEKSYFPVQYLFDKIFIPHNFRHGDIVMLKGRYARNNLGVILGYREKEYDFYKTCEGDYSDVQICVDTRFKEMEYLGEFSHEHVNPIYVERVVLGHEDERKYYLQYLIDSFEKTFLDVGKRNENRMSVILKMVEKIWKQYPDMRLGQLLMVVSEDKDLFDIEDKDLMHKLFGHLDEDSKQRLWSNDDEEYDWKNNA